ncbi:MAG: hypothetical protein A4E45_01891 [Methanosaeta sp. PtaB.Bin039]|nr:MAG: hypothetical protein A4E45_01891 [Methanosaeta sp. PtaB.Bin039]OPY45135.1 MAG: hypothetical protein A4E47_01123 [Methanosaeta sp. PtaU1.Bin028]HOT07027.1 hypothetical protein [Methanotrichaceae archaeon]HQF16045.1 hypothetical protein [Methanotrichaceae archaeon]HQI90839.1 hypothetical protein [Methanotrichaceae archaeon]
MYFRSRCSSLLLITALAAYVSATIACLWHDPWLVAALLLPATALLVRCCDDPGTGSILALSGAAIGPLTESVSVVGSIWSYAETGGLPLIPPWNLPLWACVPPALVLIIGEAKATRPSDVSHGMLAIGGIALELALFLAFYDRTWIALPGALVLAAMALALFPARETLICFTAGGILGPMCEAPGIAAGAWSYSNPEILGFPAWLPAGYAVFAALLFQSALFFAGQFGRISGRIGKRP